ncbi:MAG: FtsX-like permease family protein [Thermoanaerobacterales bacterium]|jgi:putative ABC transport system permease protein|nr:FtsX-like permease family protein [Thermoanaerobacterales bacterium]
MWRTTMKSLAAHKRRLLATCSAVLLGVAFLAGMLVLGDTLTDGFGRMFTEANSGTDVVVRSSVEVGEGDFTERGTIDRALVDEIAAVDGVESVAASIVGHGRIVGADGDPVGGNGPPTYAGNWITDDDLNPYDLAEGRAPAAPGEVVIDKAAAKAGDLEVGDTTIVRTPEPVEVTIVGLATFGEADSQGPITWAAFTDEFAEEVVLRQPGQVTSIVVGAEEGVGQEELARRIDAVLPEGVESLTGAELTEEQEDALQKDFLGFLRTFMLVFAGIALVVATFSIYNTFSILVAQRTRESALLRAVGASRGQVLRSVALEALVVGLVASAGGIALGIGLATGLLSLMEGMSMAVPGTPLAVGADTVAVAAAVGVLVTLLASIAPAVRASRVAPLAALRDVAVDRSGTSRARAVGGALAGAAGVALVVAGATGRDIGLAGIGALVTLVGVVTLGPVLARPAAGALGAPLAARSLSGALARRNAMRNPRRTAGTAAALMIGVAVVSLFTVVAASVKRSVEETVDEQFAGDLVVATDGWGVGGLPVEMAGAIAELPEVDTVVAAANAPVRLDGEDDVAAAVDVESLTGLFDLEVAEGSLDAVGDDGLAVSERYAEDNGLALGDVLQVELADGSAHRMEVRAVYGNDDLLGGLLLPRGLYLDHAPQPADLVVMVRLADDVTEAEGEAAVQAVADRFGAPDVQTDEEYAEAVGGQVDQLLTVVYAMLALAILIALMGIANTLSLSIHERTRELGLLRAVGQTRRQLRAMVRGEAVTVALFGTLCGLGLGLFLGWAMVEALADEGFTSFALPTGQLAVIVGLGAVVGVLAALRPARRAARLDVLEAIATD